MTTTTLHYTHTLLSLRRQSEKASVTREMAALHGLKSSFRVLCSAHTRRGAAATAVAASIPARTDVVIIGGGLVGTSVAYHLAKRDAQCRVTVIEKDVQFKFASSSRSLGGIRVQFAEPENVKMSMYGLEFLRRAHTELQPEESAAAASEMHHTNDLGMLVTDAGYLYLANSDSGKEALVENHTMQQQCGVEGIQLLEPRQIQHIFPWMNTNDVTLGSYGVGVEGAFDPPSLQSAMRKKAMELGRVHFVHAEVCGFTMEAAEVSGNTRIQAVHLRPPPPLSSSSKDDRAEAALSSDQRIHCRYVVNAAGPFANSIVEMAKAAMSNTSPAIKESLPMLPVCAKKRNVFVIRVPEAKDTIMNCPLIINPSGVFLRQEGPDIFLCGVSPDEDDDPSYEDTRALDDVNYKEFDDRVWPALYDRSPSIFEKLRLVAAWAGFYDYNVLDQNAIIGPHSTISNLLFANGFSGHGVQQAPAVGRAISELILDGSFIEIDLSRMRFSRFEEGTRALVFEKNII